MSDQNPQTLDTLLTQLNGEHLRPLYGMLSLEDKTGQPAWQSLAALITTKKGTLKFKEDWQFLALSRAGQPAQEVIRCMHADRRNVGYLLGLLDQLELYRESDHIRLKVLHESPPDRAPPLIHASHPAMDLGPIHDIHNIPTGVVYDPVVREAPVRFSVQEQIYEPCGNVPKVTKLTPTAEEPAALQLGEAGSPAAMAYQSLAHITHNFSKIPYGKPDGHFLGEGGFADVYHGTVGQVEIAIKHLKYNSEHKELSQRQFEAEVESLKGIKHDYLLPVLGYSMNGETRCIIYKYAACGCLRGSLACVNDISPLTIPLRVRIAQQLAEVLQYLHQMRIWHRDVTSANVMLDEAYKVQLGDFGQLKRLSTAEQDKTSMEVTTLLIGTQVYMPAEDRFVVSDKLDVYAYGVVLLELLTGLLPYDVVRVDEERALPVYVREMYDPDEGDDITEIVDRKVGDWPKGIAQAFHEVAIKCLTRSRKRRPAISDVVMDIQKWSNSDRLTESAC